MFLMVFCRYFPCHDGSCYEITQICDGTRQCEDGIDEMGCTSFVQRFYFIEGQI